MNDFEEIAHTGGKIRISVDGTLEYNHSNPHAAAFYQLCFLLNGVPMGYIPPTGFGARGASMPEGSTLVLVFSDKEGFFGRSCPSCNEYFRTDACPEICHCPYCGHSDNIINFTTKNQKEYINSFLKSFVKMLETDEDIEIDLDQIINDLPNNKSSFVYSEERQQKRVTCKSCGVNYDILGELGFCPHCRKRNSLEVFFDKLTSLEARVNNPIYDITEREKRENEWTEVLKTCISDFEAFARDIQLQLLEIPAIPQRKKELTNVSFQNVVKANETIVLLFGIDFFSGLADVDKDFINKFFHRRHLFTHNAGIVDEEYLQKTGDKSVRLREKIRLRSKEVRRLISLVKTIGQTLFEGYESIE